MSKTKTSSDEVLHVLRIVLKAVGTRDDIHEHAQTALAGVEGSLEFIQDKGTGNQAILTVVNVLTEHLGGDGEAACKALVDFVTNA